ncbi:MAG: glutamine--fructose-6-phosphate transaminase (isomerizing) [archaeon]
MCGIFGVVSKSEKVLGDMLYAGGQRLSYRGYDSVGCATISGDKIDLRKDVGTVDEVSKQLNFPEMSGSRGLIQLRWATFGAPAKENAQPHFGCDEDMVGAHNGNITNTLQLQAKFKKEGHEIRSTNDGELCVHAVEHYYDQGKDMVESLRLAYKDLHGDYAFMVLNTKENALYAIKKGSGLVVGLNGTEAYCSSDLPSILPLTNKIVRIKDNEILKLTPETLEIYSAENGFKIEREPEICKESMEAAQKGGYEHFMLKEIHEQPNAARDLVDLLNDSKYAGPFLEKIQSAKKVFFVGCGTSRHACMLGSYYFNKLAGIQAIPVLPQQLTEQYGNTLDADTAIVFVSQSGETKDVLNALKFAKEKNCAILGVLNVLGSTLMHESDIYLPLACGYEISVPATKTFLNQAVLFLYLAAKAGDKELPFSELHDLIQKTIDQTSGPAKIAAKELEGWAELYYLGYGITHPIAHEGALKLKEITYMHCEGIFSSEFKHGPLSAVEKDYPVAFLTAPDDAEMMVNHINEVACRDGKPIIIAEENETLEAYAHTFIKIPKSGQLFFPLLAVVAAQLISYYASVSRGLNPDFPRNLSKTLTVD